MSLRLCSQQAGPAHSDAPQGHTQQRQLGALRHPLAGSTDGAGGVPSQAAETAFLKGCTGSAQLQARLMHRGCSPAASSIWQVSLLILTSQQSPLQGKWQLSLPHLTDWCCGLRTYSCHSQFFSISPSCSCSPEKSSSLHDNPKRDGNTISPCTPLKHNMRLQQQALQKHPWRVMSLPQATTANSKPSEKTVRDDLGHSERAKTQ